MKVAHGGVRLFRIPWTFQGRHKRMTLPGHLAVVDIQHNVANVSLSQVDALYHTQFKYL